MPDTFQQLTYCETCCETGFRALLTEDGTQQIDLAGA